ncbi:hypothetical protein IE53DRAFT_16792 [Violaceomyces palustris]|uniref:Uncharacterized protein n=1 Tax=Violaceomyces palustris TaxID=1673888 RepID=A0ACD0NLL7_9BASI|nr:hypothetical protein IE53DRAFT_16792 [Violaceomyces palustris]
MDPPPPPLCVVFDFQLNHHLPSRRSPSLWAPFSSSTPPTCAPTHLPSSPIHQNPSSLSSSIQPSTPTTSSSILYPTRPARQSPLPSTLLLLFLRIPIFFPRDCSPALLKAALVSISLRVFQGKKSL